MMTKARQVPGAAPHPRRELSRRFGARVRALRQHHKKTQIELAAEIGCPAWKLSRIERARLAAPPSFETLIALRQVLHVSIDYLVTGARLGAVRDPRLSQRLGAVDRLPPDQTDRLLRVLDAFLDDPQVASYLESA